MVFFETISNPTLEMIVPASVVSQAHYVGAIVIIDSVFLPSVFSNALKLGTGMVFYLAIKHIDGEGRLLNGFVLETEELITKTLELFLTHTGGLMGKLNA